MPFRKLLLGFILISALLPADCPAISLFDGSRKRLYNEGVAAVQSGDKAGKEGRPLDQIQFYRTAQAKLRELAQKDAEYRRDEVKALWEEAGEKMSAVAAKIRAGEIVVPDPDQILAARDGGYVSYEEMDGKPATMPDVPTFRQKPPEVLLRTTATTTGEAQDDTADEEMANPLFANTGKKETPAVSTGSRVSVVVTEVDENSAVAKFPLEDRLRVLLIRQWLESKREADAVLVLESVLEKEGEATSVTTRLLYARALLACGNFLRAGMVLEALPKRKAVETDPMVRSLRAAVAIAQENYPEALFQLEQLWNESGKTYADALVDMTYVQFLMDPVLYRKDCIEQYRLAVERGAARDRAFERTLQIEVVE